MSLYLYFNCERQDLNKITGDLNRAVGRERAEMRKKYKLKKN